MKRLSIPARRSLVPATLAVGAFVFIGVLGIFLYQSPTTEAAVVGWNAGRIIDDDVFTDHTSMSAGAIQTFLNSKVTSCDTHGAKNSEMNNSGVPDYNGNGSIQRWEWGKKKYNQTIFRCLKDYVQNGKKASQIIYEVAQKYKISPKVLLVLLQKEQGLVSDTWPLNIQYRSATGYGCPDTAPCDSQYYGLTNQLTWAAKMFRSIMDASPSWYTPYILGNNYIGYNPDSRCGGRTVNIQNRATQALYNYTPYQPNSYALNGGSSSAYPNCGAFGNRNFYTYFKSWFGSTTSKLSSMLIRCDDGNKYLFEEGENRKRLIPPSTQTSWKLTDSEFIEADYGCGYPNYGIELSNLVRIRSSGNLYLIDNGRAYRINNQDQASAWNLGSMSQTVPQINSTTLKKLVPLTRTLPRLATSTNPDRSDIYLIDGGKRYYIRGTQTGDESSYDLVRGYDNIPTATMSVALLQTLPLATDEINFSFNVGSDTYFLDHAKIRRLGGATKALWSEVATPAGPTLTSQILSLFPTKLSLNNTFERDGKYYKLKDEATFDTTTNPAIAKNWSPYTSPTITRLLTNKLLATSTVGSPIITTDVRSNIRLVSCSGINYMVERYIQKRRQITGTGMSAWDLNTKYFFKNDKACNYGAYDITMADVVRSRNTGKVYHLDNGEATWVRDQSAATALGIGDINSTFPKVEAATIHGNFTIK